MIVQDLKTKALWIGKESGNPVTVKFISCSLQGEHLLQSSDEVFEDKRIIALHDHSEILFREYQMKLTNL